MLDFTINFNGSIEIVVIMSYNMLYKYEQNIKTRARIINKLLQKDVKIDINVHKIPKNVRIILGLIIGKERLYE